MALTFPCERLSWTVDAEGVSSHLTSDSGRRRDTEWRPVNNATNTYTLNDDPHPHVDVAFGLIVNPPPVTVSTKSTSAPFR